MFNQSTGLLEKGISSLSVMCYYILWVMGLKLAARSCSIARPPWLPCDIFSMMDCPWGDSAWGKTPRFCSAKPLSPPKWECMVTKYNQGSV